MFPAFNLCVYMCINIPCVYTQHMHTLHSVYPHTQVGIWPYAGIDIAAFELMKEWLTQRYAALGNTVDNTLGNAAAGATSPITISPTAGASGMPGGGADRHDATQEQQQQQHAHGGATDTHLATHRTRRRRHTHEPSTPPRFPLPTPLGPTLATQVALHSGGTGSGVPPMARRPPRDAAVENGGGAVGGGGGTNGGTSAHHVPPYALFCMGMLSSSLGQLVAYPLSLVRARLQAQGAGGAPAKYAGMVDVLIKVGGGANWCEEMCACVRMLLLCIQTISEDMHTHTHSLSHTHTPTYPHTPTPTLTQTVRHEGLRGLYKGVLPDLMKTAPAAGISWLVFEWSKQCLEVDDVGGGNGRCGGR